MGGRGCMLPTWTVSFAHCGLWHITLRTMGSGFDLRSGSVPPVISLKNNSKPWSMMR